MMRTSSIILKLSRENNSIFLTFAVKMSQS
nr:MAG TPA: hypothetical protein [Caudoviricetes sp.]